MSAHGREAVLRRVADEILSAGAAGVTRVAIDGVDGAGKTTFADELGEALEPGGRQVIRVSADDFLNPRGLRYRRGRASPEGFFLDSYDYEALERCVLAPLGPGGSRRFRRRAFDLHADQSLEAAEETAAADGSSFSTASSCTVTSCGGSGTTPSSSTWRSPCPSRAVPLVARVGRPPTSMRRRTGAMSPASASTCRGARRNAERHASSTTTCRRLRRYSPEAVS